jgi:hypothetical protein
MSDVTGTSAASPDPRPDNPTGDHSPAPWAPSTDSTGSPQADGTGSPQADSTGLGEAPEPQDRCIRCQADLTGDRRSARFCPRCGARRVYLTEDEAALVIAGSDSPAPDFSDNLILSEPQDATPPAATPPPVPVAPTPAASQAAAWVQMTMGQPAGTAFGPHTPIPRRSSSDDVHSLMLLGYANAMYRLGWRYETGLGNGRNPQEALRCYFKAAKLGNIAALSRLAPQCVAAAVPPPAMKAPQNGAAPPEPVPPPLDTGS